MVEKIIADALKEAGIGFKQPSDSGRFDFELPRHAVFIECKRFYSDRAAEQLQRASDVILIQGIDAARCFADLITAKR